MANSFGSFGPAGPGFGSIQNISGPANNPTAFPTAPPPAGFGGGIAPGGLGGSPGLGNMVGVNLQPSLGQGPAPQAFRAPLPLPPPLAGTGVGTAAAPAPAAAPQTFGLQPSDLAKPSALNPIGNLAFGMSNWGGMMSPQAQQAYANSQFAQPGDPRGQNTNSLFGLGGLGGWQQQPVIRGGGGGM